jgi:hypothetical protein
MTRSNHVYGCAIAAMLAAAACGQTMITQWNFNSNPSDGNTSTGTLAPSFGTGTAACYSVAPSSPLTECQFASGAGSTDPETSDDSGWQTRGYQAQGGVPGSVGVEFAVSTVNFTNVIVKWDHRHSNTSSRYVALFYSTDGVTFTQAPGPAFEATAGDTWFNERTVDLSSITAVNDNPNFRFRISPVFDPSTGNSYSAANPNSTYASTGTHRFDMVTVSGTAINSIAPMGAAAASPGAVCLGGGQITLSVVVQPGINPASTGLTVSADLTNIGGSAAASLADDGLNGDAVAGDNTFTLMYAVPGSVTAGVKQIPVTISDAQSRSSTTSASVTVADCSTNSTSQVVISQVYGGGGNLGPPAATFNADFVELYNRSNQVVDLTGWSVQYASAGSINGFADADDRVALSGVIRPGQYLLVQMSDAGTTGLPLPAPDFAGNGGMGNNAGRVALVRSTALIGTNCSDPAVEDLAAYGGALCFEGAAPTAGTANDTGIVRKVAGAQDTNQNFHDFTVGAVNPRNRAFGGFLAGYGSLSTGALCAGDALTLTVNVSPAASPASTGIQVRADLSQLGGSATQALTDSGSGVWTLTYNVPGSVTQGAKSVPITVTDAQGRADSSSLVVSVAQCSPAASRIVISGFFTGGGNAGAPFNVDHVEIFNRSQSAVDITGWSLQYADADSALGFLVSRTVALSGSIGPGEYRLIQTSNPGANGVPIPTPDFVASPAFGMDNQSGRIALVRTAAPLGANCGSADIEDLVGYGELAICLEGIGATANVSNSLGGYRKADGCQDFNHNVIDFDIISPLNLPRNSASPANLCPAAATGACCAGSTCSLTTAAACVGSFTEFAGIGTTCNLPGNQTTPCCKADYNQSGSITVQDIFDFLSGYFSGSPLADINSAGGTTVQDIFDYLAAYFAGGC